MECPHCIRGFVLTDYDELKCINCGRPAFHIEILPWVPENTMIDNSKRRKYDWDEELTEVVEGVMA